MNANESLQILKNGNARYLSAKSNDGNISLKKRKDTFENGQHPHAVILTCSDSRVVPEHIFMAGIGELFVIRVAGNIVTDTQLASVVYAAEHLKSKLVVVLGHTNCGAVGAAIGHAGHGCLCALTAPIEEAIGSETDDLKACELNVKASVDKLLANDEVKDLVSDGVTVTGAIYDVETGEVKFL